MNVEPFDWNVVVVGYWNPAILTPAGIARRLFGLKEGTPILVEVPVDGLAPHRVRHDNLTVTAEMGRLVVSADSPKYDLLDRARGVAVRAIEGLPETPLAAVGYNVKVKVTDPPGELLTAMDCSMDNLLSDAAFSIESRTLRRTLKVGDGVLNIDLAAQQEKGVTVLFNFHRASSARADLVAWLKYPISEVERNVTTVLENVLRISISEIGK